MTVERYEKPWGYELLVARTARYAGKILCVNAGCRLSLQHHAAKDETLFLLEGDSEIELDLGGPQLLRRRMSPGESYRVPPGQKHRISALTDARVLEVSTPELDDVVRWEDDYARVMAPVATQEQEGGR